MMKAKKIFLLLGIGSFISFAGVSFAGYLECYQLKRN
jgi:hypothetical protein